MEKVGTAEVRSNPVLCRSECGGIYIFLIVDSVLRVMLFDGDMHFLNGRVCAVIDVRKVIRRLLTLHC